MSLRNFFLSILFAIAVALSAWSILLSNHSQIVITKEEPNQPDSFMEDVIAIVMNKLGNPSLKIESPKMIHYSENDKTELMTPHIVVFRESPQPWHINANRAVTKQGVNEITFWDNVVIHHLPDTDNPMTTLRTKVLTIFPNEQLAKTSEAITVTQPDLIVHAIGMLANWNLGTIKLLSNAREEYVPNS